MEVPQQKKSSRAPAILALIFAFVAVIVVIAVSAGSGDSSGDGASGSEQIDSRPATQEGQEAVARGFYVVGKGDTLSQIAQDTGVEEETITELNPGIDPQALSPGQRIRLR